MELKKVLFVIPSLKVGGMERVMSEIINFGAKKTSLEIHVVLYGIKRDVFYPVHDSVIVHRPAFEFNNHFRFIHTIKTLFFLRGVISELKADTILSFGEYWNSLVLLSIFGKTQKIYVSDRCNPEKNLGGVHERLRKYLYTRATGIIVQTEHAKSVYSKYFNRDKLHVISNPIRNFENSKFVDRENIVLTVGRFIESKNIDLIIRIFCDLKPNGWKLVVVGDDDVKQSHATKYRAIISEFGMETQIQLIGFQQEIDDLYLKSKIFVFASQSEGFPNVVGEALMAGLPTIVFDCIPSVQALIPENVHDLIIPFKNEALFKNKLLEIIQRDGEICNRMELTKHVQDHFSNEIICEQYLNCLLN